MNTLIIDTATEIEFICLAAGGRILEFSEYGDKSHSLTLFSRLENLIKESGIILSKIELLVSGTGPGSFTGIRIGMSSCRMLSQVLGIPAIGISSHLMLALSCEIPEGAELLLAFDARKDRVFGSLYRFSSGKPEEIVAPGDYSIEELLDKAGDRLFAAGSGISRYADRIEKTGKPLTPMGNLKYSGERIIGHAIDEYSKRRGDNPGYLDLLPLYARKPDAEANYKF